MMWVHFNLLNMKWVSNSMIQTLNIYKELKHLPCPQHPLLFLPFLSFLQKPFKVTSVKY